jgi:hypothetical protein
MKVEITIPDNATVGTPVAGSVTATSGGSTPPPPPAKGAPMAETPADGRNAWVSTKAGGDGKFSAAVPSGNASWKVKVAGKLTIDGGMDYSPCKAGDTIEWMMTTPAYQDDCTYTISLP